MTREAKNTTLRQRAETRLREKPSAPLPGTEAELRRLVHELEVHQVELENQNEDLRHARAALEASHALYADLYDFAPVGYLTLDAEGVVREANLTAAGLLGVERSALVGRRGGLFVAAEARAAFTEFLARVFAGPGSQTCEVPLAGGATPPRYVRIEAAISAPGDACRAVLSDITARRQADAEREHLERQLRQAQKLEAIGTLAGGIAHDLNNILTPIVAHAELGLMHLDRANPVREDLTEILRAADRAAALVRQILVLGRKERSDLVPVDLGPLVRETMKFLRATLPTTIEIRVQADAACGPVRGDLSQLHQVLLNLCTNAAYAMQDRGGVLTVSLEANQGEGGERWVRLCVQDTGTGMPAEVLERIFEPYFTTKPIGKGSGLGLALVHGIVTKLGGQLRVRSAPGEGTTFVMLLPEMPRRAPAAKPSVREIPRGAGQHVLVVDDEGTLRGVLQRMLVALGYRVTEAPGSAAAVAAFQADPQGFDAVFTDYTMPEHTGLDLAGELLRLRPDLPVVLGTGYAEGVDAHAVAERGVRALVMKPYTARSVGEALAEALAGKR